MIKRFTVAVAALFMLGAQAFAAGTISFSLSQQLDEFGNPLANCFLYLIQAGTVNTPQNGYQDSALSLVLPNPLRCDASGRLPQFFLADGSIKVRLTKSNGVNVLTADGILVIGASSGGGGGSPVDATTVLATGDVKVKYGTGALSGFVRMNGRTLGSSSSGATERANADAQALFQYLWDTDSTLSVSGGRGASSAADWAANKTITLPDMRGRALAGLDDMGNSAAGVITSGTCFTPTVLGFKCGVESRSIVQANLPAYTLPDTLGISNTLGIGNTLGISNTLGLNDPGHTHPIVTQTVLPGGGGVITASDLSHSGNTQSTSSNTTGITLTGSVSLTGSVALTGSVSKTGSVTTGGGGQNIGSLPPVMLFTVYIKL